MNQLKNSYVLLYGLAPISSTETAFYFPIYLKLSDSDFKLFRNNEFSTETEKIIYYISNMNLQYYRFNSDEEKARAIDAVNGIKDYDLFIFDGFKKFKFYSKENKEKIDNKIILDLIESKFNQNETSIN